MQNIIPLKRLKTCQKCKNDKSQDLFNQNKRYKDGYAPWCKECRYSYDRQWSEANYPSKRKSILKSRAKKFGISYEEYLKLIEEQNNKCKICKKSELEEGRALAIDHCHKTGKVRGLLCHYCNRMLGLAKDNISILANAILYLENSNERR